MPYDVVAANRQATQTGLALGQAMASNALRMQELQSQEAWRQMQERHVAQEMQYAMEQHDLAIQERADMAKALGRVQAESQPALQVPFIGPPTAEGGTPATIEAPNPHYVPFERSMLQNVTPVLGKYRPQSVAPFVQDMAMYPYRMAEARRQEALAAKALSDAAHPKPLSTIGKMLYDQQAAIQAGDTASAQTIQEGIQKLHADAASEVQRMVQEHKRLTGHDFSPEEVDRLYRIKAGLEPRAAVVQPVTFEKFANKQLEYFMENKTHFDAETKMMRRPSSVAEAMVDMRAAFDAMQSHIKGLPSLGETSGSVPTIDTNAPGLTAGAISIGAPPVEPTAPAAATPDADEAVWVKSPAGKIGTIPRKNLEKAKQLGYTEYEG